MANAALLTGLAARFNGIQEQLSSSLLASLAAEIAVTEKLHKLLLGKASAAVAATAEDTKQLKALWKAVCDEVAAGRISAAHGIRGELASRVSQHTHHGQELLRLLDNVKELTGEPVPHADEWRRAFAWVERFEKVVLPAWTGPDELEELVGEHYPLSSAELDAIGAKHPAPAAWYEQDGKPF
jgi:hypothetical protein